MLIDKQLEASLNGLGLDKKQAMILLARSTLMDGLKNWNAPYPYHHITAIFDEIMMS